LTAVTAEFFYLGGQATLRNIRSNGIYTMDAVKNKEWLKLLNVRFQSSSSTQQYTDTSMFFSFQLPAGTPADKFAAAQLEAGDAVMTRLYDYVSNIIVSPKSDIVQ
jgi:hypothetical protein